MQDYQVLFNNMFVEPENFEDEKIKITYGGKIVTPDKEITFYIGEELLIESALINCIDPVVKNRLEILQKGNFRRAVLLTNGVRKMVLGLKDDEIVISDIDKIPEVIKSYSHKKLEKALNNDGIHY